MNQQQSHVRIRKEPIKNPGYYSKNNADDSITSVTTGGMSRS